MTSSADIPEVEIDGDMIRLGQFLKFADLIESGGEGKEAIAEGLVAVNGEIEVRRGRQLHDGDIVDLDDRTVRVRLLG
ncbi:RNA-binding S4 domain-containing protein [Microbacterium sp. ZW T5_56]|uniref:RNA-binding S4 domain-containing protein n=1 Tax=Microbacterium sp. ZW T5_56 TaxID=3378081 RepID=UPI003852E2CC